MIDMIYCSGMLPLKTPQKLIEHHQETLWIIICDIFEIISDSFNVFIGLCIYLCLSSSVVLDLLGSHIFLAIDNTKIT